MSARFSVSAPSSASARLRSRGSPGPASVACRSCTRPLRAIPIRRLRDRPSVCRKCSRHTPYAVAAAAAAETTLIGAPCRTPNQCAGALLLRHTACAYYGDAAGGRARNRLRREQKKGKRANEQRATRTASVAPTSTHNQRSPALPYLAQGRLPHGTRH